VDDTWIYVSTPFGTQPFQWQHSKLKTSQVQNDSTVTGTNADDALEHLDSTKVPTTRTLTINGTTQDLSANRTFTIATGLTVGTTPITSGTVGRVLFEGTGNVLQESANLTWDNTNSRLGIGTASPTNRLSVIDTTATYVANFRGSASTYIQIGANTIAGEQGVNMINSSCQAFLGVTGTEAYFVGTSGATIMRFSIGGSERMRITGSTGNVLIGTITDAGFKLDVNGTARVSGFLYSTVGTIIGTGIAGVFPNGIAGREELVIRGNMLPTDAGTDINLSNAQGNCSLTSGIRNSLGLTRGFVPTSGTGVFNVVNLSFTINQTGGANGITRGLYINPTLTAAADFRAIETTRGRIVFGNLPTSSAGLPTGAVWNDAGTLKIV
jgi:hypothetical protein